MIRPGELGPSLQKQRLFLVLGEEDCLRDQAIETIRAHGALRSKGASAGDVRSNGDDFSCDVLYGDETNAQEILARAQEVPFFSTHQVVLLKWADKLPTKEGEALVPYFAAPSDSTTMIVSAGKLDGRLKWVQALKKQAVVVNCAPLYENQRLGWVRQEAARVGIGLDAEAAGLLKELAGEGLYVVRRNWRSCRSMSQRKKRSMLTTSSPSKGRNPVRRCLTCREPSSTARCRKPSSFWRKPWSRVRPRFGFSARCCGSTGVCGKPKTA